MLEKEVEETKEDVIEESSPSTEEEGVTEDSPTSEETEPQMIPKSRFDEVNEQKKAALEMLELERRANMQQTAPVLPLQAAQTPQKPRRQDFVDEDDYLDARDEFVKLEAKMEAEKVAEQNRLAMQQADAQRTAQAKIHEFHEKLRNSDISDIQESYKFVDLHTPGPAVAKAIIESESPDKLVNFLAKNPSEMAKIRSLADPTAQAVAIGRLEARIEPPKITKKTTSAPPPPTPVSGDTQPATKKLTEFKKPKNGWTDKEYARQRKEIYGY